MELVDIIENLMNKQSDIEGIPENDSVLGSQIPQSDDSSDESLDLTQPLESTLIELNEGDENFDLLRKSNSPVAEEENA